MNIINSKNKKYILLIYLFINITYASDEKQGAEENINRQNPLPTLEFKLKKREYQDNENKIEEYNEEEKRCKQLMDEEKKNICSL